MQKVSRHGGNSETSSCAICVHLPLCRYMAGTDEETEGVVGDGFWFGVLVGQVGSGRGGGGGGGGVGGGGSLNLTTIQPSYRCRERK